MRKCANETLIKSLIALEALSFFVLRLILCGTNLYEAITLNQMPLVPIIGGIIIYLMSTIWLCGMLSQLFGKRITNNEKRN